MNRIIRLGKNQRNKRKVQSAMLAAKIRVSDEEMVKLLLRWLDTRTKEDQDTIVLGNLFIVENIVSRLLAHWPDTHRFVDDMVSEGVLQICEMLNRLTADKALYFRASLTNGVRNAIERSLHRNRSSVSASLSTEYAMLSQGKPLPPKQDRRIYE